MGKARKKPGSNPGPPPAPINDGSPRRWDCSGGEDFTSRGLEKDLLEAIFGLLRMLKGCSTRWRLHKPFDAEGYLRGTRGTPNHRFGTRLAYYAWAMAFGTDEQRADAQSLLLEFFTIQVREGHMLGELMTTSHPQIWYSMVAAARAFALHYADEAMTNATGLWLRHDAHLLDLVTVDGVPVSPGARPAGRSNPLRTAIRSVIYRDEPCPPLGKGWGNPNVATNPFWSNTYNAGAFTFRELKRDGDDLGGVTRGEREQPVLRDPMYVQRDGEDYVFSIPHFTKSGPGVMTYVARIGGVESDSGEYRKGNARDWDAPDPIPDLGPRSTVNVVCGGKCRPYDMDSDDDEGEVANA